MELSPRAFSIRLPACLIFNVRRIAQQIESLLLSDFLRSPFCWRHCCDTVSAFCETKRSLCGSSPWLCKLASIIKINAAHVVEREKWDHVKKSFDSDQLTHFSHTDEVYIVYCRLPQEPIPHAISIRQQTLLRRRLTAEIWWQERAPVPKTCTCTFIYAAESTSGSYLSSLSYLEFVVIAEVIPLTIAWQLLRSTTSLPLCSTHRPSDVNPGSQRHIIVIAKIVAIVSIPRLCALPTSSKTEQQEKCWRCDEMPTCDSLHRSWSMHLAIPLTCFWSSSPAFSSPFCTASDMAVAKRVDRKGGCPKNLLFQVQSCLHSC